MKCLQYLLWAGLYILAFTGPAFAADEMVEIPALVLNDDSKCTSCHDESDKPDILKIGQTRHGTRADGRTPTCVSCHGDSKQHIKEAEAGEKKPPAPTDIVFGKRSKNDAQTQNEMCLACHQGSTRVNWQSSTHATRDVTCTSCHDIHSPHDSVRDKQEQSEVCFDCHKEQRAQLHRPSHHPVLEGEMACSDCHNVHDDNPKQLTRASVNETCYTCHMEKRGPFVLSHEPVAEDCGHCHNAHGTTADNLLKHRVPYLCRDCHGWVGGTWGDHPGALPSRLVQRDTNLSRNSSTARGCLKCHAQIHGSNSLVDDDAGVRLVR